MIFLIIFLSCLVLVLSFGCYNLLKKTEKLEDIIVDYSNYSNKLDEIIELSNKRLKEVDEKESFKSDDEVGFFFNTLKEIQETLNEFKTK